MFKYVCFSALVYVCIGARCGEHEFFEFKFTPKLIGPVNPDDQNNAHGRCGHEKECDIVVQLYGKEKCKKGKDGIQMNAPDDKNIVESSDLTPSMIDKTIHSESDLSGSRDKPFSITVCDRDSGFRGSNDEILNINHGILSPGCTQYRHEDDDEDHPWFIEYEICCQPIGGSGS